MFSSHGWYRPLSHGECQHRFGMLSVIEMRKGISLFISIRVVLIPSCSFFRSKKIISSKQGTKKMLRTLLNDEAGFIVSAELVLVATILVIGMIVGLSEIQHAVVAELNDVADAIGSLNQSYCFSGFSKAKGYDGVAAYTRGSIFFDTGDECDNNQCDISCDKPLPEGPKRNH